MWAGGTQPTFAGWARRRAHRCNRCVLHGPATADRPDPSRGGYADALGSCSGCRRSCEGGATMTFASSLPSVVLPQSPLTPYVLECAGRLAGKVAFVDGPTGRTMTYGELD